MIGRITHKACVNVSRETREVNVIDGQSSPARPLPHLQVTQGSQQPMRRNRNAERRQRRRARQLQTQKAGTTICQADTEREAQARVSSEFHYTRDVRVWRPEREAQKAYVSEASLPKRDIQRREVHTSPQRHETRVSITKCGTQKVRISQVSLARRDNQQHEVCVSQQKHKTGVSKP